MINYRGKPLTATRVFHAVQRRLSDQVERPNAFRGVYGSFREAAQAAPRFKPVGYDSAASDDWYLDKLDQVNEEDYPAIYWLRIALETGRRVYEIGGHVGVAYYGYQTVFSYPEDLQWTICDVPSVVAAGRALAIKRGRKNLNFVTSSDQTEGADIMLAAGALQYVDSPTLADSVSRLPIKPMHVIVNKTPVRDGPSFVTLQNIVSSYCPYRIFDRAELVRTMQEAGYDLVAAWHKARKVLIPGHPDKSTDQYAGFYFRAP